MAGTASRGQRPDYLKWAFFALMALCTLGVIVADERFLVVPTDPEWAHIQPFKWYLAIHGPFGAAALFLGPWQFSDTLRRRNPNLHRWIGRLYIGAITIAAGVALYFAPIYEPRSIQVEQYFQAGGWLATTGIALFWILRRNIAAHKLWMMRSYGFCLVFVLSRVPDVFHIATDDQALSDHLWSLVIAALIAPELILNARILLAHRTKAA